jgi:hypothetical protein
MKIGVLVRHEGLLEYFKGVLYGKDVNFYYGDNISKIKGDEDIYITTIPSLDVPPLFKFNKPIISYPCLDEWDDAEYFSPYPEMVKYPKFRFILNHPVWARSWHKLFPDTPIRYIPYAYHQIPKWHGTEKKVIVISRLPERLLSYTSDSIPKIMEGLDYEIHSGKLSRKELFERIASCRVMFYFSNSPWTCVFCEALSIGIPIITINEHPTGDYANIACSISSIPKYLSKVLDDYDLAKSYSLRNLGLANEIMNYNRAKELWKQNIEEMLNE